MDNKRIGQFISNKRKELGMTQLQLADMLDVSNKTVSKWETGEGYPDILTIPKLCQAIGVSADDFFAGEQVSNEISKNSNSIGKNTRTNLSGKQQLKAFFLSMLIGIITVFGMMFLKP